MAWKSTQLAARRFRTRELPPILAGTTTRVIRQNVGRFYASVAEIFEAWIARRSSQHTQRAYRSDVMSFVRFLGINWPQEAPELLRVSTKDVQAFGDLLEEGGAAPKTLNRRISSVSSFYKYLAGAAAELRLPIIVPNPAHAQFLSRASSDPRKETRSLSATRARQLLGLPAGDTLVDFRDRAILKFYLYSGARLGGGCRLKVSDFHQDGEQATIRIHGKGDSRRTIGLHSTAAEAISEYIKKAEITSGPLFRPRASSRSGKLSGRAMDPATMYRLIQRYLERLPGSTSEVQGPDGSTRREYTYSTHSLRATTATLTLEAKVDIRKVQELLGHRNIATTQGYDRRRSTSESASHDVPI